jgi:hypothetical protein
MTNHWNQSRSSFRTGEPVSHLQAKEAIGTMMKWSGYDIQYEYPLLGNMVKKYTHNYDIVGFKQILVVEIDDPALHSKPRKVANDKVAMNYTSKFFPHATFLRLNKDEINSQDTIKEYLEGAFWPYV